MKYIVVPNWDKYQQHMRRSPPWIKLHSTVIEPLNEDGKLNPFFNLPTEAKAVIMLTWVLASRNNGVIVFESWEQHARNIGVSCINHADIILKSKLIRVVSNPFKMKCRARPTEKSESREDIEGEKTRAKPRGKKKISTAPEPAANPPAKLTPAEPEALRIWEGRILPKLCEEIDSASFETWIKPIVPLRIHDSEAVLGSASNFCKNWLLNNYHEQIVDVLSSTLQREMNIRYEVIA